MNHRSRRLLLIFGIPSLAKLLEICWFHDYVINGSLSNESDDEESMRIWKPDGAISSPRENIFTSDSNLINEKNVIELENRKPGTTDWILSKPAMHREVEGYMSKTSVQKGENISLYYSVNQNDNSNSQEMLAGIKVEVFRTGWYGGVGGRRVLGPVQVPGISQIMPNHEVDGLITCNWKDPYIIQTSPSWTTGVYLVKMTELNPTTMAQSYAIFVLRDDHRSSISPADIMFQLPVNTYQAYNIWGGKNLYRCTDSRHCEQARKVSFDRPYARAEDSNGAFGNGAGEYLSNVQPIATYPIKSTASWNYNMVRWMERNNLDVTYITNLDVHTRLPTLRKSKLFLTQGHDEYWTWAMRDHVTSLRDQGVDLAFLGSNTAYWQIRYEHTVREPPSSSHANATGLQSDVMLDEEPRTFVCYRRANRDPDKSQYRTVKFRLVRPEALLVGVEYLFPLGDPFDEDMIVADHSHWIFNGTNMKRGDKIPGMLGYEVDRIREALQPMDDGNSEEPITNIVKVFETPLVNRKNQTIISHGGIYKSKSGANVFGSGTMQWSWGLDDWGVQQGLRSSRLNDNIVKMTWNLLEAAGISVRRKAPNPILYH